MFGLVDGKQLTTVIAVVAGVSVVLHLLFLRVEGHETALDPRLAWQLAMSGTTAAGIFYFAFQKWLWKLRIFQGWLVKFPNLSGTWTAKFAGRVLGKGHEEIVTIDHRFDRLIYRSISLAGNGTRENPASRSAGTASYLNRTAQDQVRIFIAYENEPGVGRAEHGQRHEGCLKLTLQDKEVLTGEYWTNKLRKDGNGPDDKGSWGHVQMTLNSSPP